MIDINAAVAFFCNFKLKFQDKILEFAFSIKVAGVFLSENTYVLNFPTFARRLAFNVRPPRQIFAVEQRAGRPCIIVTRGRKPSVQTRKQGLVVNAKNLSVRR